MIDIKVNLCEITTKVLSIGLEGEQNHVRIVFDAVSVLADCPEAIPSLAVKAPSGVIYPKVVTKDGTSVYWVVSASDCAQDGAGNYQLTFINDDEVIKTFVGAFRVYNSLTTNGPAPDPIQQWIDEANEALGTISGAVERAENAATASETAQGKAEDAQTAAETAQGLAEAAEEAAETAEAGAETAQGKAEDAQAAAESARDTAEGYVTEAQGYASAAQGYADNAAGSAETAGNKAQEASGYADNASGYASDAQGYANEASGYVDSASGYATQASGYADDASGYATTAGNKATEAGQSATAAAGSATTAGNKATEAGQSASYASASALKAEGFAVGQQNGTDVASGSPYFENNAKYYSEQAEQSAEDAEQTVIEVTNKLNSKAPVVIENASGSIATFTDGADGMPMSLTVGVEPVQDLHGQANPYPPGGGVNFLDGSLAPDWNNYEGLTTTKNPDGSFYVNGTATGTIYKTIQLDLKAGSYTFSGCPTGGSSAGYSFFIGGSVSKYDTGSGNTFTLNEDTTVPVILPRIISGTVCNNLLFKPMICLSSTPNPTTFSPYSNICPISGWTGCNVSRTGVNIWDEEWELGGINSSGNPVSANDRFRSKNFCPILPNTSYYCLASNSIWVYVYDENKSKISEIGNRNAVITTPANAAFFKLMVSGETYGNNVGINYPATDTAYHPGHVATYPITFPSSAGTVYGGTLTVNDDGTGVLVVDRVGYEQPGWIQYNQSNGYVAYKASNLMYSKSDVQMWNYPKSNMIGEYGSFNSANMDRNILQLPTRSNNIGYLALKEGISAENVSVSYLIMTPIVYELTDLEVMETLKGLNNVWADTGDVSVDYPADTKLYIAKELSATQQLLELIVTANREETMKATKAYSTGNLLIVNGTLYRATTSIANGATLTVGTNVAATTIATELAALA